MDLKKARNECLDRIVNHVADTKTAISIATFLVKQLKNAKESEQFDLMRAKLDLILEDLSKPIYKCRDSGELVYPSIDNTIKIYELYQLVLKEKENFVRPEEVVDNTELSEEQLKSLARLSYVTEEYESL